MPFASHFLVNIVKFQPIHPHITTITQSTKFCPSLGQINQQGETNNPQN